MFDALQNGLSSAFKTLRGHGKMTEANMREGLKLVEKSLLEADVSFDVVRQFMSRVTEQAVGEKVLKSLNPSEQVVGVVYQELVQLMGPVDHSMHLLGKSDVSVLMMCGLQGSGKTTTCGKLGRYLKAQGRAPLLVLTLGWARWFAGTERRRVERWLDLVIEDLRVLRDRQATLEAALARAAP